MLTRVAAPNICVVTGIYPDWTKIAELRIPRIYLMLLCWDYTEKFLRALAADLPHLFVSVPVQFIIKLSMLHQAIHGVGNFRCARTPGFDFDTRKFCHTDWEGAIAELDLPITMIRQYQCGLDLPTDLASQMVTRGARAGTIFSSGGREFFLGHVNDPNWHHKRRVNSQSDVQALGRLTFYSMETVQIDVPLDNGRPIWKGE